MKQGITGVDVKAMSGLHNCLDDDTIIIVDFFKEIDRSL